MTARVECAAIRAFLLCTDTLVSDKPSLAQQHAHEKVTISQHPTGAKGELSRDLVVLHVVEASLVQCRTAPEPLTDLLQACTLLGVSSRSDVAAKEVCAGRAIALKALQASLAKAICICNGS